MRSQTRLWGYSLKIPTEGDEMTSVRVDSASDVTDQTETSNEIVPVESEHKWEREAEDDVLDDESDDRHREEPGEDVRDFRAG